MGVWLGVGVAADTTRPGWVPGVVLRATQPVCGSSRVGVSVQESAFRRATRVGSSRALLRWYSISEACAGGERCTAESLCRVTAQLCHAMSLCTSLTVIWWHYRDESVFLFEQEGVICTIQPFFF